MLREAFEPFELKGLGCRQTGVYSQASERQKANSGLMRRDGFSRVFT
jgi:hypothetical protein